MRRLLPALLFVLVACAQFPELDATATPGVAEAEYPRLVPLERLLEAPAPRATEIVRENVKGRAAALKARAARLRAPVVDAATRARMRRGVRGAG
ncbi:hypothetical protein ACOXXX_19025 [Thalassococcus sp. BH17M4-6]|uniref:hypothetical protein n=1 Tax=Thalassococcus sp. BH17M4-6 TaxID=3413148 RepID=UPI003BD39009